MPLIELTPRSFDPSDSLEQVDELLSALAKEDRDDNAMLTNPGVPPFKRTKTSSAKDDSKAAVLKRQVKAAKSIASACQWVLKQLEIGRIRRTFEDEFEDTHFLDTHLSNVEVKWLEDRDSVEKVLSISCLAYARAPKWEAFPRTTLSEEDLKRIAEEKEKHLRAIEEANALGSALLVRVGGNAAEGQHIVEYVKGNADWLRDQLLEKRSSKKKKGKDNATPVAVKGKAAAAVVVAAAAAAARKADLVVDTRCAVEECTEAIIEGSCTHTECSSKYKFCDLHLNHNSHSIQRLRVLQQEHQHLVSVYISFEMFMQCNFKNVLFLL